MIQKFDSIALLGTSADPPTLGHEALLQGLSSLFPKVATWASNNPMKEHGASLDTRHTLLKTLVEAINNPVLEVVQDLSSPWSITTLERASNLWPKADLTFVIGSDLISEIPNWVQAKSLFKKARLGIAPREGWPINNVQLRHIESLGAEIDLLPLKVPNSSSSSLRANLETTEIPQAILPILIEENLYELATKS